MRGRGLKRHVFSGLEDSYEVALHARAWIETLSSHLLVGLATSRPPCEGVD